jgi:hypothetical protein
MKSQLTELLANTLQLGVWAYFIIGFLLVGFISFRGPKHGFLTDPKYRFRNVMFFCLALGKLLGPIAFLVEVLLWPLWLVCLWAFAAGDDE